MNVQTSIAVDELLDQVKLGNRVAEQHLFEALNLTERVRVMVRTRMRGRQAEQDDVVSEILAAVLKNLRRGMYDPAKGSLELYIWGIARNRIKDFFRYRKDHLHVDITQCHYCAAPEVTDQTEVRSYIARLLHQIDQKYRQVVMLRFFEELTIDEIADMLDISHNQVNSRLYYALKLLRLECGIVA